MRLKLKKVFKFNRCHQVEKSNIKDAIMNRKWEPYLKRKIHICTTVQTKFKMNYMSNLSKEIKE